MKKVEEKIIDENKAQRFAMRLVYLPRTIMGGFFFIMGALFLFPTDFWFGLLWCGLSGGITVSGLLALRRIKKGEQQGGAAAAGLTLEMQRQLEALDEQFRLGQLPREEYDRQRRKIITGS